MAGVALVALHTRFAYEIFLFELLLEIFDAACHRVFGHFNSLGRRDLNRITRCQRHCFLYMCAFGHNSLFLRKTLEGDDVARFMPASETFGDKFVDQRVNW